MIAIIRNYDPSKICQCCALTGKTIMATKIVQNVTPSGILRTGYCDKHLESYHEIQRKKYVRNIGKK